MVGDSNEDQTPTVLGTYSKRPSKYFILKKPKQLILADQQGEVLGEGAEVTGNRNTGLQDQLYAFRDRKKEKLVTLLKPYI